MHILDAHHFRLPACRFVLDLFDKSVLPRIVLEDEDESDEGSSEEGSESSTGSEAGEAAGANGVVNS